MIHNLKHDLKLKATRDETSRQEFVSTLRGYILVDMASNMQHAYHTEIAPEFVNKHNRSPVDGQEVHAVMKNSEYFKFYSSIRYNAQEMVWRSVTPVVQRGIEPLIDQAQDLLNNLTEKGTPQCGSLSLDKDIQIPKNVSAIDVHLAPGSYHSEYTQDDLSAGAIYDNGLNIFAANLMGENLDDIGQSMANFVRLKYPEFKPKHILDCGCTVGHNSAGWTEAFPTSKVDAIDVSAPLLRYAHARARSQGTPINFKQMNATALDYPDASLDVVFSSMFMHELPLKDIHAYISEAFRVLKPGGLFLNMELPPNDQMESYDSFYLDWDAYYNQEPYSKCFRDQNYQSLCIQAGFNKADCVQWIMPQYTYMDESDFKQSIGLTEQVDDKVGRLTAGINWFTFGAWKAAEGAKDAIRL